MEQQPKSSSRKLVYAALFTAIGVLLPMVFHMIGSNLSGTVFLPMHLPVILAGFLLGPVYGGACAVITPVLSTLLTAMPAPAVLPFMTVELIGYAVAAGIFYRKCRMNVYPALILTQVAGRLVKALCLYIAALFVSQGVPGVLSVWTAFITGIPGIVIQLVLIPLIVILLKKAGHPDV